MSRHPRPWLLALVLLVGTLAAGPVPEAGAQETEDLQHMVGWSVGDYWIWQQQAASGVQTQTQGEMKHRVVSAEVVTASMYDPDEHDPAWHKQQVWRVRGWANQTSQTSIGPVETKAEFERFQRQDDHAIVRIDSQTSFAGSPGLPTGTSAIIENFPPQIQFQFPMAVGDDWRMRVYQKKLNTGQGNCGGEGQPSCQNDFDLLNTYEVLGKQMVALRVNDNPVEQYEAYKIKDTDEFSNTQGGEDAPREYDIYWWSPKVCNWIKREVYSAGGELESTYTLKEFKCARRNAPDPSYRIYDEVNFSSTRFHGALDDTTLEYREELTKPGLGPKEKGFFGNIAEALPGPSFALVLALVALAALAVRRRP